MRISVVAVGTRMPDWVERGVAEYGRRLPRELQLVWREIAVGQRGKSGAPGRALEREQEGMLRAIPEGDRVIALDGGGTQFSTAELAEQLRDWMMSGSGVSLLIGGPDGLGADCLSRADQRWSLGRLTLPHPLVRVVLAEQLYRAWTITVNHPYHRD